MYLLILESIGTSELILIGLFALIFFGPRKLPELACSFGKAMNEFRRSTDEFKGTWQREVASEVDKIKTETKFDSFSENSISGDSTAINSAVVAPEIKEVSQADFQGLISKENLQALPKVEIEDTQTSKQNWL